MNINYPIQPFNLTQIFGVNPQNYAKFGLAGHNGWDVRTKYPDTPEGFREILASFNSKFYKVGDEGNSGYGKYFEVLVQLNGLWKVTYAHCKENRPLELTTRGERLGISDNTGNSTGPHLHFTVKRVKWNGAVLEVLNKNNGYFGAVNPQEFFDELKEIKDMTITDQTKIELGPEIGTMEVQAIRSLILDTRRDIVNLKTKIENYEKQAPQKEIIEVPPTFSNPLANLLYKIASAIEG